MRTLNFFLAGMVLISISSINAQTITVTAGVTPVSSAVDSGNSLRVGTFAGNGSLSTGGGNTFLGFQSGRVNAAGGGNLFAGSNAGYSNTAGSSDVFLGNFAGFNNTNGSYNIFVGGQSGYNNQNGVSNVFMGHGTGLNNAAGSYNTFLGHASGGSATGSGNIFIGHTAGSTVTSGDNKLIIDNSNTSTPIIWGEMATGARLLKFNAKTGVGAVTTFPTNPLYANYKLFVTGGILTDEVRVASSASGTWADYVFADDYDLKPLSEVEAFISKNKHLPNVPSAAQVKEDGIALGDMSRIQQEKIEELTLYIIAQEKRIQALEAKMNNK